MQYLFEHSRLDTKSNELRLTTSIFCSFDYMQRMICDIQDTYRYSKELDMWIEDSTSIHDLIKFTEIH